MGVVRGIGACGGGADQGYSLPPVRPTAPHPASAVSRVCTARGGLLAALRLEKPDRRSFCHQCCRRACRLWIKPFQPDRAQQAGPGARGRGQVAWERRSRSADRSWSGLARTHGGTVRLVHFRHPRRRASFQLASAWQEENARQGRIRIAIKALGDYTSTLTATLEAGAPVRVEGPYGNFSFDQGKGRQVWIAGGIGLTPFVARLEHRAADTAEHEPVDLFYSTRRVSADILARLSAIADGGAVRLHVIDTEQEAPLNAAQVMEMIPDWKASSIWFCGPLKFGDALEKSFASMGLPKGQFHCEAFDFR